VKKKSVAGRQVVENLYSFYDQRQAYFQQNNVGLAVISVNIPLLSTGER
jgi:hypothetical protein